MGRKTGETIARSVLILALSLPFLAFSQTSSSGLSFLKIGAGARSIGMGQAYTALANDATAIYWNPAGLSSVMKKEFQAMHGEWLLGSQYDFMALSIPNIGKGTLGMSLSQLSQPSQEGRNREGRQTTEFGARDFTATVAYSRSLTAFTSLGLGVKALQSQIASNKGQGLALDLGAIHHLSNLPLSFGFAVSNLGPGVKFRNETTSLPLSISAGTAYQGLPGLSIALDVKQRVYDHKTTVSVGTEYHLLSTFSLRGGYNLGSAAQSNNMLSGLGAGFGLKILNYRLDYALTPFGEMGDTHRISLGVRF